MIFANSLSIFYAYFISSSNLRYFCYSIEILFIEYSKSWLFLLFYFSLYFLISSVLVFQYYLTFYFEWISINLTLLVFNCLFSICLARFLCIFNRLVYCIILTSWYHFRLVSSRIFCLLVTPINSYFFILWAIWLW